ncbi:MAG: leucyl aminopeptidase [Leptospirales bacterium]
MSKNNTEKSKSSKSSYLDYPKDPLKFAVNTTGGEATIAFLSGASSKNDKDKNKVIVADFPFFKAGPSETVKSPKVWYTGVGPIDTLNVDTLGAAILSVANAAAKSFKEVAVTFDASIIEKMGVEKIARLTLTAFGNGAYPVDLLKSKPASGQITLKKVIINDKNNDALWKSEVAAHEKIPRHINANRQLQSLPANIANPEGVEKRARAMAKEFGLTIKVFQKDQLEKMGAGGIVAVGKGSAVPPRMIILEYKPTGKNIKNLKKLALVGKGVTFDTGGISLKPGGDMHEMKYDMSGASAVLHSIAAISQLKLNVHVVASIGLAENMPSSTAIKPGDVYTAYNGKTVEVQNTDAEGRLILGDLLAYTGKNYKPDYMVNLATLTGACLVALGRFYAGLFSENEIISEKLKQASKDSLEPIWAMPMGPLYKAQLESNIADFNNIGERWGGASSAASFLSEFVDENIPWAHIDIAGIAYMKKGFNVYPTVATGYGVRLLVELARKLT